MSREFTRWEKAQLTIAVRAEARRLVHRVDAGEITRAELEAAAAATGDGEPILALQYLDRRARRRAQLRSGADHPPDHVPGQVHRKPPADHAGDGRHE